MRRIILLGLAAVILIPAAILTFFVLEFDPNRYAPDLIAAVQASTGRTLTLGGPIKLSMSWTPKIVVDDVRLSNPPGFADPELMTLSRVEARIALLPLLRHQVDIVRLILIRPDISLDTNTTGKIDWDLTPAAPAIASPGAGTRGNRQNYKIALESVEIQNGSVTIKGSNPGQSFTILLTDLTGTADSTSSPLNLNAQAAVNGIPLTLTGVVGPIERFSGIGSGAWPVDLNLAASGATATIQGSIQEPRQFNGYDLSVKINVPALEALSGMAPDWLGQLPPIHEVAAAADVVDQHSSFPAITHLSIKAAASDLSTLQSGLALTGLDIEMPSLASPISVNAAGVISTMPLSISGTLGPALLLLPPSWLPATAQPGSSNYTVALQAQAGAAKFGVTGGIATPAALSGAALNLTAAVPDLSALSGLAGTPLPGWKNLTVQGTIIDPGGLGLSKAIGIDSLVFSMDNAAFGGDASFYAGPQPRFQIALKAQQINFDPLLAAMPVSANPPAPAPSAPAAPAPAQPATVIPATRLPLPALRSGSADIQLAADTVIFNRTTYTALQGHAVLANGVLTLAPVTAVLPGGSVSATAQVDTTTEPAAATISIDAPALALSPFLKALNLPDTAEGTLQAGMKASGKGDDLHSLLGSMNGQLGLAMVNGIVDGSVLSRLFGTVLQTVGLPAALAGAQGPVDVRCFGLRVDAVNGVGTISALTLDSNRLLVEGGGGLNFSDETLGVIIRPELRVAGNAIGVPVQIGGTFGAPTTSIAPLAAVQDAAKSAAGLTMTLAQKIPGGGTLLGDIANSLGYQNPSDVCPAALALGRLGKPGPAAKPETTATPAGNSAPPSGPKSLLDSLFK